MGVYFLSHFCQKYLIRTFVILERQYFAGFYFAISIGSYQKWALNFAIQAFSTSFNVSKKMGLFYISDKLKQADEDER